MPHSSAERARRIGVQLDQIIDVLDGPDLQDAPGLTIHQMVMATGIPTDTLGRRLRHLLEEEYVEIVGYGEPTGGVGRRPFLYALAE